MKRPLMDTYGTKHFVFWQQRGVYFELFKHGKLRYRRSTCACISALKISLKNFPESEPKPNLSHVVTRTGIKPESWHLLFCKTNLKTGTHFITSRHCRCHRKGSKIILIVQRLSIFVWQVFQTATSHLADWRPTSPTNRAAVNHSS